MQKNVSNSRFSRDEFCDLIDAHLQQLESSQDARRQYAAVLAALRSNFEAFQKSRLRKA
ncbi:hypothetical protein [Hymenobacter chitinivorans]|uniref:Uncharacterized protein n=1 Tax=Hymenobacter chitinivorans DSM 11115 TaxID=1121954 RepID=A0A2M9BTD0_9BACT|nr:hypothetical protein [Hymenobacter chitinivorans]PJJ61187.1 hypothetical protein CLV45_2625 [Hymenobacter chitinivorans DSM 11115]